MGCGQGKAPRRAKKFQLIRKDGWSTQQVRCAFLFLIAALNLSVDLALQLRGALHVDLKEFSVFYERAPSRVPPGMVK
jgi:hypothetical protein